VERDKNLEGILSQFKEIRKELFEITSDMKKYSALNKLQSIIARKEVLDKKVALFRNRRADGENPKEKDPLVVDLLGKLQIRLERLKEIGDQVQTIMEIFTDNAKTAVHEIVKGLQTSVTIVNGIKIIFDNILSLIASFNAAKDIGSFLLDLLPLPFAQGGRVPGSGSGDIVPAMLTPGEFVIRKGVVDKLGSSFFAWINGGIFPSMAGHYAMGGIVSASSVPVVNNRFDVHIDRRGDVHVVQRALQKLKSNNRYFGG
jgi:hypothetical protein